MANELAREVKRRRENAGWTQRQLATVIGYSRQYVSMAEWEDSNIPSAQLVAAMDTAFGAHGELSALRERAISQQQSQRTPAQTTTTATSRHQPETTDDGITALQLRDSVYPREPLTTSAATTAGPQIEYSTAANEALVDENPAAPIFPVTIALSEPVDALVRSGQVTARALHSYAAVTRLLAEHRQSFAPDALLNLIAVQRDSVAALFRAVTAAKAKRELGALLVETSIVASRLWSAMGNRNMALVNCASARHLADELHDPALGALARLFESNLTSDAATLIGIDGDIVHGLRLLSEAAAVDRLLSPAARARIAAEQAQAYAVLGLSRECQDALGRAHRAAEHIRDADRTGLFSDWTAARLPVYEGTCWLFLDRPQKALTALNQVVSVSDRANKSVGLAAYVDLASAYATAGELEEGCRILGNAYATLNAMGNLRGIERARRARQRLQPWQHEPPVRQLDDQIKTADSQ
ncbi:helix-turn-helix transcriptional regulator [Nocardia sp. CDC159]|uniref:Helix-turn-helix transcriptional regulator n=1 Tax=Nocardia pulmonis TaxID=2951408 RepID=A0A9X2IXB6_9NOCA|nr:MULTISPECIES: helix-turn-helix transcriptional regulator [Nocardia]MCM6774459.1 helix-turn-helix transcriptional regulator [Nocardia pulmonis]MCM6787475.1 helix-turn-helix transcriptional regulator [Nocardia sp. CDC159]